MIDPQEMQGLLRLLAEADFNVTFVGMTLRNHGYDIEAADLEQLSRVIVDRRDAIAENIPTGITPAPLNNISGDVYDGLDFLTNGAGTVTAIVVPDSSTAAYAAVMKLLIGARNYYLGKGDRQMVNFADVLIQNV